MRLWGKDSLRWFWVFEVQFGSSFVFCSYFDKCDYHRHLIGISQMSLWDSVYLDLRIEQEKKCLSWLKYWKHKVLLKSLNSRTGVVIKKTKRVCEGALYIQVVRGKSALGWSIGSCSRKAEQWCLYISHVLGEEFFTTCYLCFISAVQLFPTGKQVTLGDLENVHTYFLLAYFLFSP